jgi:hypothetical protein
MSDVVGAASVGGLAFLVLTDLGVLTRFPLGGPV